jgi:hypothetical protein
LKKQVLRHVVEEAGCQSCEKLSPGERVFLEVVFSSRESNTSYRALRIPNLVPVAETSERGSGEVDGLWNSEGAYSWGGTGMWGMRIYE